MKKRTLALFLFALPALTFAQDASERAQNIEEMAYYAVIIVGVFMILALVIGAMLVVPKMKRRVIDSNIDRVMSELEMKGYDPENALIRILHRETSLYKEEPAVVAAEKEVEYVEMPQTEDHSLALTIANEFARIRKNLSVMEEGTRGLKQLNASMDRMSNNFISNGYEIVDMLNKPYSEGMNAVANFVQSDELPTGKQVITRIIKPQVNYRGEMIQSAQIEVSVGE